MNERQRQKKQLLSFWMIEKKATTAFETLPFHTCFHLNKQTDRQRIKRKVCISFLNPFEQQQEQKRPRQKDAKHTRHSNICR